MESGKAAIFIGHDECYGLDCEKVRAEIVRLIEVGATTFYSGGMGGFDRMCAHMVYGLKKEYPKVNNYLVIPYLSFSIVDKEPFDAILYPEELEKYYFKAAIPARNRYLVDHAQYALCYVTHAWGGAAKTYERALKKGLTVVNLGGEEDERSKTP